MKVKALKKFIDLKENKTREVGEVFEVTKRRYEKLNSMHHGKLVQEIKEMDKNE